MKLACLFAFAVAAATACAQPIGGHMDSIEWRVADSQLVAAGKLKSLQTMSEDSNTQTTWFLATLEVEETIKGPRHKELRFVLRHIRNSGHIPEWARDRTKVMVFLNESRYHASHGWGFMTAGSDNWRYTREPYAPRGGYDENSMIKLKAGAKVQAWTIDLRALSEPEELMKEARRAAADEPKVRPAEQYLPFQQSWLKGLELDTRSFSGPFTVSVPTDARLERAAQKWVTSDDKDLRRLAVDVLVCFKSEKNASLLRRLLDDPAIWSVLNYTKSPAVPEDRYLIREAARFALDCWGM